LAQHAQINFKLLYVFIAVAEHSSFRIAAETLNKSESAVSLQIRQLEEQLGVPLFHRTTRRVRLTREGETLLSATQRSISELNIGMQKLQNAADLSSGTLSIACAPTVAAARLPLALSEFKAQYPGISVRLREIPGLELFNAIRDLTVDFAIGARVEDLGGVEFEPMIEDPICCFADAKYEMADAVSLEEVAKHPIILNASTTILRAALEKHFTAAGLSLQPAFEVLHVHTMVALAEAGLGVAILPKVALSHHLPSKLEMSRIMSPSMVRQIGILTSRGQMLSPAAVRFLEILRSPIFRSETAI